MAACLHTTQGAFLWPIADLSYYSSLFFFQKPKVQSIDRFEQLKQAPFCQKPKTGVLNDMIIDHPAFFFHALANGKWSSTARLSLYIYKKNVPARQSLQSIQVTYTFKQTNCFALPGYIQINILPVTCNMHTSTRKLATPKQTTTTNILCMFLSHMLLTCLQWRIQQTHLEGAHLPSHLFPPLLFFFFSPSS